MTLIFKYFENIEAAFLPVVIGQADILMSLAKLDEQLIEVFAVPRPIRYTYETFYTMRNVRSPDVSFFGVILDSREGFCILILVVIAVWLTLSLRDYSFRGVFRLDAALDSAMFLIASFLANYSEIPADSADIRRYGSRFSRTSILVTWLLAILPLSVYFRGELISRLAVQIPNSQIDTLEKLELELDKGNVHPCVVKDGCMSTVLAGTIPYRNQTLLAKLQKAFRLKGPGNASILYTVEECLGCATRPGFACLSCRIEGCHRKKLNRIVVESKEPFNLAFATTPTTKGYPLAQAYDQLLQRFFETSIGPFHEKTWKCADDGGLMRSLEGAQAIEKVSRVFEMSAFLATLACLLGLSLLVFVVELALSSPRMKVACALPATNPADEEEASAAHNRGRKRRRQSRCILVM
ncbi:hypothetical protein HPB51_024473 [Rhipicephalus microplus]|uniref:Ionotropic glutamate receptor C-terminal domain-containing protein n=1 Tax=Rhipicephalus microplus TaxID=6941 RepID=A0A9J6F839_RHIMP|nr:hypothetical protein HPB51_024473 [Rhipicephalus microplus]